MQALRNIYTVDNHRIVIDLPNTFNYNAVEIIILPIEKPRKKTVKISNNSDNNERLKRLLSISVWKESDIQPIIDSENLINQWRIEEF
jgi:hypothetical protein